MTENEKTNFSEKNSPAMFDHIAQRYDKLNRVMTFGLDKSWRKSLNAHMPSSIEHWLDAATGTGDQILFSLDNGIKAQSITGIDLSEGMLDIGKQKLQSFKNVSLYKASLTKIPLEPLSCDVVTCSFGIRNVDPFTDSFLEFFRVLKQGGTLLILESSRPTNALLRLGHNFYMKKILPKIAYFMGSDPKAYAYLAETTSRFPCGEDLCSILRKVGFIDVKAIPMALGSVTLYHAKKA
jgi:demethylmenaquinone methyltransferase/2-methoxy-6-polyprenyl-1,4-benzoquinol methylase